MMQVRSGRGSSVETIFRLFHSYDLASAGHRIPRRVAALDLTSPRPVLAFVTEILIFVLALVLRRRGCRGPGRDLIMMRYR